MLWQAGGLLNIKTFTLKNVNVAATIFEVETCILLVVAVCVTLICCNCALHVFHLEASIDITLVINFDRKGDETRTNRGPHALNIIRTEPTMFWIKNREEEFFSKRLSFVLKFYLYMQNFSSKMGIWSIAFHSSMLFIHSCVLKFQFRRVGAQNFAGGQGRDSVLTIL